ncbi:MAG TPA: TetR/AcrR family transcriptional regulator [Candidatus Phocaeicola excrementigallinarum]|nr:TetR/AcrR family transcriptional regulator [Candidatus Phocaeicola excrementigallinarum]
MEHSRRKRRSTEDIEKAILEAAAGFIEEKGFGELTVTGIIQKASIEPVQFYRRYGDLNGFIDEYVKRFDYWFSDVAKDSDSEGDEKERYEKIVNGLLDALCDNRIMQQLLRWELSGNNETVRRTARLREFHTLPLCSRYAKVFEGSDLDIVAVAAMMIGGIYYLVLHKDLSDFGGIDLNKEAGRERIRNAVRQLSGLLFSAEGISCEAVGIARQMKKDNVPIDKIGKYTRLPQELIESL